MSLSRKFRIVPKVPPGKLGVDRLSGVDSIMNIDILQEKLLRVSSEGFARLITLDIFHLSDLMTGVIFFILYH